MHAAAMGGAQQEDEKDSIDQQAIFDGVVSFLPALTRLLFRRVLGADDPPFRPVIGTRGASGVVAVLYPRTFSTDLDVLFCKTRDSSRAVWQRLRRLWLP